jgi:hypothetical protein
MSIKVGKALYAILTGSTAVKNVVASKIYPIVIPENTSLPVIVYERSGDVEYTRDGSGFFNDVVDITILSEDYTECIDLTDAVYNALNMYKGTAGSVQIIDSRLTNVSETFAENSYIQKLTFAIKTI